MTATIGETVTVSKTAVVALIVALMALFGLEPADLTPEDAAPPTTTAPPVETTTTTTTVPPTTTTEAPVTTTAPPSTTTTAPPPPVVDVGIVDPIASNFDTSDPALIGPAWGDGRIPGDSTTGNFRFFCNVSHFADDDPIIHPGEPGAAHSHMFFGNTLADAFSTYESLRTTGDGTCQGGPLNRSAYWVPTLYDANGDIVTPKRILVYYKVGKTSPDVVELAPGLRMLGGHNVATGTDHAQSWECKATGDKDVSVPPCPAGAEVHATVLFGVCWDGRADSPDHWSHVIPSNGDFNVVCPESHPTRIPQFQLILRFDSDGNSDQWRLSSDMPGQPGGRTLHADWFGAWDPDILTVWTTECVNGRRNCNAGEIGDGRQLLSQ